MNAPANSTKTSDLRLEEMTRILDVASELRTRQELIERQLHLDAVKDDLRKRLLAGAKVSGEPVTAEQVDVAVEQYFDNLHAYQDPPGGIGTFFAKLYVRCGCWIPMIALFLIVTTAGYFTFRALA